MPNSFVKYFSYFKFVVQLLKCWKLVFLFYFLVVLFEKLKVIFFVHKLISDSMFKSVMPLEKRNILKTHKFSKPENPQIFFKMQRSKKLFLLWLLDFLNNLMII